MHVSNRESIRRQHSILWFCNIRAVKKKISIFDMYIPFEASSLTLLHQNRKLSSRISLQNRLFCLCRLPAVSDVAQFILFDFRFSSSVYTYLNNICAVLKRSTITIECRGSIRVSTVHGHKYSSPSIFYCIVHIKPHLKKII